MEKKLVNLWYDEEGDFLEVTWSRNPGHFTESADDRVMINIDSDGNVQGFHILGLSTIKGAPLDVDLVPDDPQNPPEEMERWKEQTREQAKRRRP